MARFIFHKENILVETDKDDNVISRFTRGYEVVAADINDGVEDAELEINSDLKSKPNRYYYTQDEQGSTIYITDKNENIRNEYCYDAFGNVLDSKEEVHNRITYTGQQFDNITQQYYLRARFYNPVVGRFTQEDVYRGDGLNLYAYCKGNPVIYYDPSGFARKPLEPRNNIVSCKIDANTGKKTYVLKYRDKYLHPGRKDTTFEIAYDKDLEALFKEYPQYLYNNGGPGSKVVLENGFSGDRGKDFREANRINKRDNLIDEQPHGYTWEHDRDKKSLYLVLTDVHGSTPHTGGHALKLADIKKTKYKVKSVQKGNDKIKTTVSTKCSSKKRPMS